MLFTVLCSSTTAIPWSGLHFITNLLELDEMTVNTCSIINESRWVEFLPWLVETSLRKLLARIHVLLISDFVRFSVSGPFLSMQNPSSSTIIVEAIGKVIGES